MLWYSVCQLKAPKRTLYVWTGILISISINIPDEQIPPAICLYVFVMNIPEPPRYMSIWHINHCLLFLKWCHEQLVLLECFQGHGYMKHFFWLVLCLSLAQGDILIDCLWQQFWICNWVYRSIDHAKAEWISHLQRILVWFLCIIVVAWEYLSTKKNQPFCLKNLWRFFIRSALFWFVRLRTPRPPHFLGLHANP